MRDTRCTGFTMVELLIVIGILGTLMVVLLPQILPVQTEGDIADTRARITYLQMAAQTYNRKHGFYPSDDFEDLVNMGTPKKKVKTKRDGVNSGIESLVIFLGQKRYGSDSLADKGQWLENTDGDRNASTIPLLDTNEKKEVVDAWGMPIMYFCAQNSGFTKRQTVMDENGDTHTVTVALDPATKKPLGKSFQLISAGPDGKFGNEDDVTYPARG